ncbi:MAG: SH3 domain-containing protein, partial [Prolixibacteraceae bacterium]
MKTKICILLVIVLASCGVNKRRQAEKIVQRFEEENIADKREVVFDIQPRFEQGKLVIEGETSDSQLKTQLLEELDEINFRDDITILPDSTVGEKTFGLINLSVANQRSAPGHSAELVTQSLMGTPVKILKKKNGWFYVQTPDKYISWIDAGGVHPITFNELEEWKNAERIVFTGLSTEAYESDEMNQSVTDIVLGAIVEKLGENRRGYRVKLPDDRHGFTPAENWITFEEFENRARVDSAAIVKQAGKLTGRP